LSVQPTTKSGLMAMDTNGPAPSKSVILCAWCEKSPVKTRRNIYCSVSCKMQAQHANPVSHGKWRAAMETSYRHSTLKGRRNPGAAQWMTTNNPMFQAESRAKASQTLKAMGHMPPIQGGNGRGLTRPQQLLKDLLGLQVEYIIPTKPVRDRLAHLPTHYKVDLADPLHKYVVEIDGPSHGTHQAQERDAKKTQALILLGWFVFRFSNQDVMEHTASVVECITTFTTSK
jgi:hypothetical protein